MNLSSKKEKTFKNENSIEFEVNILKYLLELINMDENIKVLGPEIAMPINILGVHEDLRRALQLKRREGTIYFPLQISSYPLNHTKYKIEGMDCVYITDPEYGYITKFFEGLDKDVFSEIRRTTERTT